MKVRIVVTDGGGNVFEGEATLAAVASTRSSHRESDRRVRSPARTGPDLSLPVRAFMKRHAKGLGGPQKFTVLLARLCGGKTGVAIGRKEIEKTWNRMTTLMGGKFNSAYASRARENGWVDTPKTGHYAILLGWAQAFGA